MVSQDEQRDIRKGEGRGGKVGANKGKGRCSVEREREGGGKGDNDVIA